MRKKIKFILPTTAQNVIRELCELYHPYDFNLRIDIMHTVTGIQAHTHMGLMKGETVVSKTDRFIFQ